MDVQGIRGAETGHSSALLSDGELIERLRQRAADCTQKSMTARLAAVIDLVEDLLTRRYDRSQVREILVEAGWRFTADSFDSALSRVRKRRLSAAAETDDDVHGLVHGGLKLSEEAGVSASSGKGAPVDSGEPDGKDPGPASFADVFMERKDFTAGRRWK